MRDDEQDVDLPDIEKDIDEQDEATEIDESQDKPTADGADGDDVLIGFDDEEIPSEPENATMKQMREALREKDRLLREARARVPKVEVGEKPTLESCDFDEDRYDQAIDAWKARKAQAEAEQAPIASRSQEAEQDFGVEMVEYNQQKTKLGRPDFDVAETLVTDRLDPVQQSVLVLASKSKAALVYALGKSPERLEALASITNPIKLAIAVSDLERSLKVQARRKSPEPEPRMRGGTPTASSKKLDELEAEAERTGDRTKLIAARKAAKQKG